MKQYFKKIGFKKTVLTMVAFSISNIASAAAYIPLPVKPLCSAETPCERNAWEVGFEGLWVKPVFGTDAEYAYSLVNIVDPNTSIIGYGKEQSFTIDPVAKFGFRLEGSYQLKDGRDLNINWMHFSNHTERTLDRNMLRTTTNDEHGFLSPYLPFLGFFGILFPYDAIYAKNEINFDAVNAEYGKGDLRLAFLNEGSRFRYFAGLQYANIRNNTHVIGAWNFLDIITAQGEGCANISFQGIGPRLGADFDIEVLGGFSIAGRGAVELLVGNANIDTRTREYLPSFLLDRVTTKNLSNTTVVPGLEAKIGIKYAHVGAFGVFSVEGGWQAVSYINAVSTNPITGVIPGTSNTSATAITFIKNNFGFQGPYFGVKLSANT